MNKTKTNVLILGCSGMLGSMCLDVLHKNKSLNITGTVKNVHSSESKILKNLYKVKFMELDALEWCMNNDIFSSNEMCKNFNECDYIINCIGIVRHRIKNVSDNFNAIYVNSIFPFLLNVIAEKHNIKIIQILTDCVFDGSKGNYIESDKHNGFDVYSKTKSLGEINSDNFVNLRCSIIGPEIFNKILLLEWFLNLKEKEIVYGYTNYFWNGITTLHFAKIAEGIIINDVKLNGSRHIVPAGMVSKYELLNSFLLCYNKDVMIKKKNVKKSDMVLNTEFEMDNNNLWKCAGYENIPTIKEMIKELSEYKTKWMK